MTKQDREEIARLVHAEIQPVVNLLQTLLDLHGVKPETKAFVREFADKQKVEDFWRRVDGGQNRKVRVRKVS